MQNRRPQVPTRPISQEAREFHPEAPVSTDRKVFLQCLKSAPRGSSPGPGGCTYEHLKMLLDDMDTVELLLEALTCLAQAKVPSDVTEALMGARLTALAKTRRRGQEHCHRKARCDGWLREFWLGSSCKSSRVSVPRFSMPYPTRAGTDCVGHFLRAATDANPRATSVDGVGAYDHVLRSAMLERLLHMPKARAQFCLS